MLDGTEISPEQRWLLQCASGDKFAIGKIADWDLLLEAAEYHGLLPLLAAAMEGNGPDATPPEVAGRLRDAYRYSARRAMFFSIRLLALLDALREAGIPALPLKGPALAEWLYPDPALRPFSDLDLLVHRQDVPAALRLLAREGYTPAKHIARLPVETLLGFNCEVVVGNAEGVQVDLQWAIAPADYPFRFDAEMLWRSTRPALVAGREVPGMGLETLLLFLSVHGAKHLWSRLMWLGDIARLARRGPDWDRAMELATEAGCARPVLLGLLLAHELFGDAAAIPAAMVERARGEVVIERLARQVVLRLGRIQPSEPDSLELVVFNAAMAERTWHKVRHYAALLRAPTEAELQWLALPPKLFFLYYPVRAVRMGAKYIPRLARASFK